MARRDKSTKEAGVAIVSALLVVSLSAILVSGLLWLQSIEVQRVETQRMSAQADWIFRNAIDWTRLTLRSRREIDPDSIHFAGGASGEDIPRISLDGYLGQVKHDDELPTYFSGSIEDAQARFNLRNLVSAQVTGGAMICRNEVAAFQRLLSLIGLDPAIAMATAAVIRDGLSPSQRRFGASSESMCSAEDEIGEAATESGGNVSGDSSDVLSDDMDDGGPMAPLQMVSLESLLEVNNVTPEAIVRLRQFVTILPRRTAVNMNTAPAKVLAAVVPGMSLQGAEAFVARREKVFFRNTGDLQLALSAVGLANTTIDVSLFDVTTHYIRVHGLVEFRKARVRRDVLLYRDAATNATTVLEVRDLL